MRTVVATLASLSPYSQSRHILTERKQKEQHDEFERRAWRERCHVNEHGYVVTIKRNL